MKRYYLFILVFLFALQSFAQQKLVVKGKPNALFVEHKVGEKESLSSVGRIYGLTASQLARFNGKSPSSLLSKGSIIKVPFKISDIQKSATGSPLYHEVDKGENLFKIAQRYNKIPVSQVRSWNKLSSSASVKNGQELIIGYLKTTNTEIPVATKQIIESTATEKQTETAAVTTQAVVEKTEPIKKTSTVKEVDPGFHPASDAKIEANNKYIPQSNDEGFFASLYVKNDATLTQQFRSGDAATFKTISGWTDRKYYVLVNNITPGTIVRITASNNKSICARVLASLPETKGAEALLLRMSNSAASALDIKDQQFTVTLTYFE